MGAEWRVRSRDLRTRKDPSLKVPTLTPYYVHVIQDHMKKKRPQPQGTYAHALPRTRPTKPPEEEKTPASRYLRSRFITYTPHRLPKWGGVCLKVFDYVHDYGFNKKQIDLGATGLSCLGWGQNKYGGYSKTIQGTQKKYRVPKTNIEVLKSSIWYPKQI